MKQAAKRRWPKARGGWLSLVRRGAIWAGAVLLTFGGTAWAGAMLGIDNSGGAVLDSARSGIQFVSVKNIAVAEVHHFPNLGGTIDSNGAVAVDIPLADVETHIPIRNERMGVMLFEVASFPVAALAAQVDMAALKAMRKGHYTEIELPFELSLHGKVGKLSASLGVTRLDNGIRVATLKPVIVSAASFGLTDGVERLRKVVGLSSIATAVPVTAQLVFVFED